MVDDTDTRFISNDARTLRDARDQSRFTSDVSQADRKYYEELGTTMSSSAYDAWKKYDDMYTEQIDTDKELISNFDKQYKAANREYKKAKAQVPSLDKAVSKAWNKHKNTLKKVSIGTARSVVNEEWAKRNLSPDQYTTITKSGGDEDDVVSTGNVRLKKPLIDKKETWYLPPTSLESLYESLESSEGVHYETVNGELVIDTTIQTGKAFHPSKSVYGKLKDELDTVALEYKTSFDTEATEKLGAELSEANELLFKRREELNDFKTELLAAKGRVSTTEEQRQLELDYLRKGYEDRVATLKEVFG